MESNVLALPPILAADCPLSRMMFESTIMSSLIVSTPLMFIFFRAESTSMPGISGIILKSSEVLKATTTGSDIHLVASILEMT